MKLIIKSLLDLDLYKITMMNFAFINYPKIPVKYGFTNRTDKKLAKFIDKKDLINQIVNVRRLKVTNKEIAYLKTLGHFSDDFLSYLKNLTLPKVDVKVVNDDFEITTDGTWCEAILWETIILSLVNEMYYIGKYSRQDRRKAMALGAHNLSEKIELLRQSTIMFTDFGTRRRLSQEWQETVVRMLSQTLEPENFMGTSNVYLAMKLDLVPVGTNAHEHYMIMCGMNNDNLIEGHRKALDMWYDLFGYDLSIALTDTFGSKFFFEDFGKERAKLWKGFRQDSGDPVEFGETAIKFYEDNDVDPKDKLIIFSDGLNLDKILELDEHFKGRIKVAYGWGTTLTNDVGFETLSIVMKAIEVNGIGLVKLSDNLNKAMGSVDDIQRYKEVFGYINTESEETIV